MKPEPCNCFLLKRDGKRPFPFPHSSCRYALATPASRSVRFRCFGLPWYCSRFCVPVVVLLRPCHCSPRLVFSYLRTGIVSRFRARFGVKEEFSLPAVGFVAQQRF